MSQRIVRFIEYWPARFIHMMEQDRIIGPGQGAKPREILVGFLQKVGR